jgi:hypothetical protein
MKVLYPAQPHSGLFGETLGHHSLQPPLIREPGVVDTSSGSN